MSTTHMDTETLHRLVASEVDQADSIAERMGYGSADEMFHSVEPYPGCWEAEAASEAAAEMAAERYYEDRGYDDARAQEEYEARMGVIPFDVASAMAARR